MARGEQDLQDEEPTEKESEWDGGVDGMIKDDLTYKIIGCAMKVHSTLGAGFQEGIYQKSLEIEMNRAGLSFGREVNISIFYEGFPVGTRRADFVVADRVVVELKALSALENIHFIQAKNYVEAFGYEIGLLINFGAERLEYKRIYKRNRDREGTQFS